MKLLKKKPFYEWLFLIVLFLYPLRHVNIGLDLWDTGYSYVNFTYGLEHMDSMWFFSTYLANVIGHFFSMLPFGNTLIGLNIYTSLVVSAMARISYCFLRKSLQIPSVLTFIGVFLALNLSWCPTAILYNYLTYFFMLLCTVFLYKGLSAHQNKFLYFAGICLGANVFVRFSNAAEAALIVGVWAYAFIETLTDDTCKVLKWKLLKPAFLGKLWSRIWHTTLWCLGGYLTSLVAFLGYISIRYGLNTYITAISRLFGMTEESTGYTPKAMLLSIYYNYRQGLTWVAYLVVFGVIHFAVYLLLEWAKKLSDQRFWSNIVLALQFLSCLVLTGAALYLLYQKEMFSFDYHGYTSMVQPMIVLLILVMMIAIFKVLAPNVPKEEKLISGLVILVNFITSIGSNTGLFPSINNTYILMPYFVWQLYKLLKDFPFLAIKKWKLPLTPIWTCLLLYFVFIGYQSVGFGSTFVFAEANGVVDAKVQVTDNEVLSGVKMPAERAASVQELSDYVNDHQLKGRLSMTYWGIPALSYYLQIPPAFNAWIDLASYQPYYMKQDLDGVRAKIDSEPSNLQNYPVFITTTFMATYEGELANTSEVNKWLELKDFLAQYDYKVVFQNEQFTLYDVILN